MKTLVFTMLVELSFTNPPLLPSRVPRLQEKRLFAFLSASAWYWYCLRRLVKIWIPQPLGPKFSSWSLTIDCIRLFLFRAKISSLPKEKTCFVKTDQAVRVMTPFLPGSRHAPGWLHLGHYATSAVVHPAQNMVFQHQTELEIAFV